MVTTDFGIIMPDTTIQAILQTDVGKFYKSAEVHLVFHARLLNPG
jgi:hypothetical protein